MTDIVSIVSAVVAIVISIYALILSKKQFSTSTRLGQLPFLNIDFIDPVEGNVPNVASIFDEDKNTNMDADIYIKLSNIGLGLAKDICFEYDDNFHQKICFFAFNNVLTPNKTTEYSITLVNLVRGHFDKHDFELNIYYKDLFSNAYLLKTHGIYSTFGEDTFMPKLIFISETQKIKRKYYPKIGLKMRRTVDDISNS